LVLWKQGSCFEATKANNYDCILHSLKRTWTVRFKNKFKKEQGLRKSKQMTDQHQY